jgi:diguanylate cyclase (GGDEF)-like protein
VVFTHSISTTISLGVSIFPLHGKNYDTLVKKADYAMYEVKKEGRNNYKIYQ